MPRWSVVIPAAPSAWQEATGMTSMSGLPVCGSRVWVGAPLFRERAELSVRDRSPPRFTAFSSGMGLARKRLNNLDE
jgi:hypothetical protein